jgi:hypothetical protein
MKHLITALLWGAAILTALAQRAVLLWREALSPSPALLQPAGAAPLPGLRPLSADELSRLTRRQLQQTVGTRRNLPKARLIELALAAQA